MFDLESQLQALADNYGLAYLLEQNEITELFIIRYLVDEGMIDLRDYFNTDAEMQHWKEWEE